MDYARGCFGCEYCQRHTDQIGWEFYGCHHSPYAGKIIDEIKRCPKEYAVETCRTCKHRQRWRNEFSPKVTQVCELKKGRTEMGFRKIKVTDNACELHENDD